MALTKIDDRGLKTPIDLLDNENIRLGTGNDLKLYHDGSNSHLNNITGNLLIGTNGEFQVLNHQENEYRIRAHNNGGVDLYYDHDKKLETTTGGVNISGELNVTTKVAYPDNAKAIFGTGDDLQIYHDAGAASHINATGLLNIDGTTGVRLEYNNATRLETTSAGVTVTGDLTTGQLFIGDGGPGVTDNNICVGDGKDLKIYHDGDSTLYDNGTGDFKLYSNGGAIKLLKDTGENMAVFNTDGNVELYHDNVKRIATNSSSYKGAIIHGDATNTSIAMQTESTARGYFYANNSDQIGLLDAGGDWAIKHANDAYTEFRVGTAVKATVNTHGITFNGDTAAANALDDYEEGTYTVSDASGQSLSITNGNNGLTYTKVGRIVYCTFDITYPSNSDTNHARVDAPFTATNYGNGWVGWCELGRPMQIHISGTNVYFMDNNSGGNGKHLTNAELSGVRIIGGFMLHQS